MNIWKDIDARRIKEDDFIAYIEIGKGMKNKYELDKETGILILDRILYTSTHYPANYGFIPHTYADDKDPLDVLVLCSETILPGSEVRCYPIGVMRMIDQDASDEKIIAVPFGDPNYNMYHSIDELPEHVLEEIKHFFSVYKNLEHKKVQVQDMDGPKAAKRIISDCIKMFEDTFEKEKK
ncbi:MAG: inorganic diphosphatase [Acholeplasmatales bacterium]|nr:inorganic diphosphatase [Acholeplasmatales bacterium]